MKYYSEETVKGILEQIDSHYVKELDGLQSVNIPDKHGKLKDTDVITNIIKKATEDAFGKGDTLRYGYLSDVIDMIEKAPIVVESIE